MMEDGMIEKEVRIVSIAAPSVPLWAVFTDEEEGEPEIWTERVQLWAHIRTGLSQDNKGSEAFLGNEVPPDQFKVEAMVLVDGDLVLVSDSGFAFMGYSTGEEAEPRSEWEGRVKTARKLYRRRLGEE
jgi:hypothetical protein